MQYEIRDGLLEIRDATEGHMIWRGSVDGGDVVKVVALPESEDCVVIITGGNGDSARNLIKVRKDGSIAWRAEAPPEFGNYVDIDLQNGDLMAWSWSCYLLKLDPEKGTILDKSFTK